MFKNKSMALQIDMALYCRTGVNVPETTIQENTAEYRRMIFNVIKNTLKTAYPLTVQFIGKKRWKKAVHHFFENHSCKTPQVWKLPLEFYEFYIQNPFPFKKEYPQLLELLLFEWIEIEVFMMEDLPIHPFQVNNNSDKDILVPNPEIKIVPLHYPVHLKKTKTITVSDKSQYFVSVHRDYYSKEVKFNDLSYPFVVMLLKINEEKTSLSDLENIYKNYEPDAQKAHQTIQNFIQFSVQNNLILGYASKTI